MITIPTDIFRAAMAAVAREDVRYYLTGFYINVADSQIISTDGARIFLGDIEIDHAAGSDQDWPDNIIFSRPATLPAKTCSLVEIRNEGSHYTITYISRTLKTQLLPVIAGTYPDYKSAIPSNEGYADVICVNPQHLADVSKELTGDGVQLSIKDASSVIQVSIDKRKDFSYYVMPTRY